MSEVLLVGLVSVLGREDDEGDVESGDRLKVEE